MRRIGYALLAAIVAVTFTGAPASAFNLGDDHKIFGLGQIEWVLAEDAAKADTASPAGETTTRGFSAKRLRLGLKGKLSDGAVFYVLQMDGAGGNMALLDYVGGLKLGPAKVFLGQTRPWTTYTTGIQGSGKMRNITRAKGLRNIGSSFFYKNSAYRDRGLFVKLPKVGGLADIQLSYTNGLGRNQEVGGDQFGGTIYSTTGGMMSAGAIIKPMKGLRISAIYAANSHDNVVAGKGDEASFNIDRTVLSAGGSFEMGDMGLVIDGEFSQFTRGSDDVAGEAEEMAWYARVGYQTGDFDVFARYGIDTDKGVKKGSIDSEFATAEMSVTAHWKAAKNLWVGLDYTMLEPDEGDSSSIIRVEWQSRL